MQVTLKCLKISKFSLIDDIELEFHPKLNLITGESGAGKSTLLQALGFLSGQRSKQQGAHDSNTSSVTAVFLCSHSQSLQKFFDEKGLTYETDDQAEMEVIVRRSLTKSRKSQAWVNDQSVTRSLLQDVCGWLFEIVSQHASTKLGNSQVQTELIDNLVDPNILKTYRRHYRTLESIIEKLEDTTRRVNEIYREYDYVNYRLEEIDKFDPSTEDYAEILNYCKHTQLQQERVTHLREAQTHLFINDHTTLSSLIEASFQSYSKALGTSSKDLINLKEQVMGSIDEYSFRLEQEIDRCVFNEVEWAEKERRIGTYQELMRKCGVPNVQELIKLQERLQDKLETYEFLNNQAEAYFTEACETIKPLKSVANALADERRKVAESLIIEVKNHCKSLGLQHADISVHFCPVNICSKAHEIDTEIHRWGERWASFCLEASAFGPCGSEYTEFLMTTNPGDSPKPLGSLLSGGEASRLLIAFKGSSPFKMHSPVLIFDEVDSGVSGKLASQVGRKLLALAAKKQVIAISHIPQVIAYADCHHLVKKHLTKDRTIIGASTLDKSKRIKELARILSGNKLNQSSYEHAHALIKESRARG